MKNISLKTGIKAAFLSLSLMTLFPDAQAFKFNMPFNMPFVSARNAEREKQALVDQLKKIGNALAEKTVNAEKDRAKWEHEETVYTAFEDLATANLLAKNAEIAELTKQLEELKTKQDYDDIADLDAAPPESYVSETTEEINGLKETVRKLESKARDHDACVQTHQKVEENYKQCDQNLDSCNKEIQTMKAIQDANKRLQDENAVLNEKYTKIYNQNNEIIQSQNKVLEEAKKKLEKENQAKFAQQQEDFNKLAESTINRAVHSKVKSAKENIKEKYSGRLSELEDLKREKTTLLAENKQLRSNDDAHTEDLKFIDAKIKQLNKEIELKNDELNKKDEKLNSYEKEMIELKEDLELALDNFQAAETDVLEKEKTIKKMSNEIQEKRDC